MQVLLAQAERSEFNQACLATGVSVTGVPCTPEPLATTQPMFTTMEATNGSNLSNASYETPTTMPELNTSNMSNATDFVEVTTEADDMDNLSNVSNLTGMMENVTGQLGITFTAQITVADFANFSQTAFLNQLTSSLGASAQEVRVTAIEYEVSVTYAFSSGITVAEAKAAIAAALNVPASSVSVSISAARRLDEARHLAGVSVAATVKSTDVNTARNAASLANDVAAVTAELQQLGVNTTGSVQVMPVSIINVITEIVVQSEAASNTVQMQVTESSTLTALGAAVGGAVEVVSVTVKKVVAVTPAPTTKSMTNASDVTSTAPIVDVVYFEDGNSTPMTGKVGQKNASDASTKKTSTESDVSALSTESDVSAEGSGSENATVEFHLPHAMDRVMNATSPMKYMNETAELEYMLVNGSSVGVNDRNDSSEVDVKRDYKDKNK